ncbi:MAG: trypsin-like peptidase domain-containing protein [Candidatus Nanopelagicales bacterium]|nr:trypsin-like peptidase domain-containing protein [Candidatus Nanopelagicales bacterium]MDZ4248606.1 trypsin-like peptidase domain-containing protein [Candidatus Nanopelagicales bacterium]
MAPIPRCTRDGVARRESKHPLRSAAITIFGVAIAAAALALPGAAASAQLPSDSAPPSTPLEQVQALVQPAVVYEQITWTGWVYDITNGGYFSETEPFTATFQCTGFVVNPDGYVATAGHCVNYENAVRDAIFTKVVNYAFENNYYEARPSKETIATFSRNWRVDGKSTKGQPDEAVSVAYGVSVSGEPSGKALPARIIKSLAFDKGDVALLKIKAQDLTVVPLSNNANTGVGTEVVSIGYPISVDLVTDANFNPSFKEGSISAEKTTSGGLLPVYEISAAVSGGMSGGPTVSKVGDVIGVNSFGITGEPQSFNFVQPSGTLQELLRGEGVENSLGKVTDLYRTGLTAYFAGDRDAAIQAFDQVIAIVPNHQFAQQYKRKAQELPASGLSLGSPAVKIGLVVVVVLVIIVVVVIIVVARRRRKGGTGSAASDASGPAEWAPPPAPQPSPGGTAGPVTEGLPPAVAETAPEAPGAPAPVAPPESQTPLPAEAEVPPAPQAVADDDSESFCPNCGKQHAPDAHFCPHCGQDLT